MNSWEAPLRRGLVELAVLAVLASGESYGYRIVEELGRLEGMGLTESTVYPVLARLARDGSLAIRTAPSPAGPARRYYRLTAEGKQRFQRMEAGWKTISRSLSELIEGARPR